MTTKKAVRKLARHYRKLGVPFVLAYAAAKMSDPWRPTQSFLTALGKYGYSKGWVSSYCCQDHGSLDLPAMISPTGSKIQLLYRDSCTIA